MATFFNSAKIKAKFDIPHAKKCILDLKQFRTALLPIKLTLNNYRFKPKKSNFLKSITFVDGLNPLLYT